MKCSLYSSKSTAQNSTFHRDWSSEFQYRFVIGDPLAPLCFAPALDECIPPLSSVINIWYLDDGVLGRVPETVTTELDTLRRKLIWIGLKVNTARWYVKFLGERGLQQHRDAPAHIQHVLTDFKEVVPSELTLIGSLLSKAILSCYRNSWKQYQQVMPTNYISRYSYGYVLLSPLCISARLTHLPRSAPVFKRKHKLSMIDEFSSATFSQKVNFNTGDDMWEQATLPTRHGVLGIKMLTDVSIPFFVISVK